MIIERPWLGHGPMHFADVPTAIAAGPHNSVLQIATEWGLPAATLFVGLVAATLICGARALREPQTNNRLVYDEQSTAVCAYFGIVATASQSLVNGNLSEPNSQLWMAITSAVDRDTNPIHNNKPTVPIKAQKVNPIQPHGG